ELALIKLTYLQQALEITASGNGVAGKKAVAEARPIAFRGLSITEMKLEPKKAAVESASAPTIATVSEELAKAAVKEIVPEQPVVEAAPAIEAAEEFPEKTMAPEPEIREEPETPVMPAPVAEIPAAPPPPAMPVSQPSTAVTTGPPPVNTKLTALGRIRQQYTGNNGAETVVPVKPLTLPELLNAWSTYTNKLKEARNPAVQSFELAELRIISDASFEVVTSNSLEQNFILQERVLLTEHLHEWFNNKTLTYLFTIEEKPDRLEKLDIPLSSKEQYQRLIREYPLVKELKDRLRLDLDY
ncbi:MAG TPA: hypothetical protein VJ647_05690, partial [Chitinophagaceae bacterium]|nr:hypothetical protein [Chitinophagaceae bacterium]